MAEAGEFIQQTAHYQAGNALALGRCARLAYSESAQIKAQAAAWGYDRFTFLNKDDTQGFVIGNASTVVVAFRGTEPENLRDWAVDFDAKLERSPFGRVQAGFQGALLAVWRPMTEAIAEYQNVGQSLWLTGHSLGAALATIATAHLRAAPNDKPVYGLYTFGSPRVGDRDFEQGFNDDMRSRAFRFVNNNDVVTRVPPRVAGFSHVGTLLYFDANGDVKSDPALWFKFVDSIKGGVENLGKLAPDAIRDHSMDAGYLPNLKKNLGVNPLA